ncbi:hypothetical protein AYO45_04160 [Gammaproteobacteria bacterium SCGC AG-212-F23]|nr:hypothetical protein AYO45_04160 [Gammaproteobacteria bacterium SCGC AG-212-F23]
MEITNKKHNALNYNKIIVILCLVSSLARFVLDSYLPSVPAISHYFAMPDKNIQFALTLYLLGFSLSQLIYGPLSDHYGRRTVMLVGLTIFIAGNLACSFALTPQMLLLARLLAGIGAGACGVLNRAIASDCFKGAEFSKAWSYTTTALVITLCLAPVLGGCIQEWLGWRANFMLATVFVGIVFFSILKYLPETHVTSKNTLQINKILRDYYFIITNPTFLIGTMCYTLAFAGLIAYFQVSPLLLMNHFGLSPTQYGYCSLVIAISYFIGGLLLRRLIVYVSVDNLLLLGASLLIAGGLTLWMIHLCRCENVFSLLFSTAIYVVGARIVIPNAIAGSLENVRHLNGSSSALIGCMQMLGSSFISWILAEFNIPLAILLSLLGILTLTIALLNKMPRYILSSKQI